MPPASCAPMRQFSTTLSVGISMKCWCTMPMPMAMASLAELKRTGLPSMRISPEVGLYRPHSTFISVLLPAPFSPRSVCTSPCSTVRQTSALASTPGNCL